MSAISIRNVSKSFGKIRALDDISLDVDRSEIFGLIGPDGAGKTTLFRLISTLLLPDKGSVDVCGFDVVKDYREIRKRIGYMAGRFSLYHDLTVEENLKFYASVFGTTVDENYELIKDIYKHIETFRKRRAGALSGGMKQKLALSCALIHKPEILVLDEPTTGVDAVSRKEFWDMLHKIKTQDISIIVSTPYMDEALRCDRVGLIHKSKLLFIDRPENIYLQHKAELYSVKTRGDNYRVLTLLREKEWCSSAWLFGQEIHAGLSRNMKEEEVKQEFSSIDGVINYERITPGIEDTFIELMGNSGEEK